MVIIREITAITQETLYNQTKVSLTFWSAITDFQHNNKDIYIDLLHVNKYRNS